MAQQGVSIPALEIKRIVVTVKGDSPLIFHRKSQQAKEAIAGKQQGKATKRTHQDPEREFKSSLYAFPEDEDKDFEDRRFGFPAIGFKKAAVRGAKSTDMAMTDARAAFFINGPNEHDLVHIEGEGPEMREDMVKIGRSGSQMRYRGQMKNWSAKLYIEYNSDMVTADQVVNLINIAGFGTGVGDWRPEKDGQFGRFHVATSDEVE